MITTNRKNEWYTNAFLLCVLKWAMLFWVCTYKNKNNHKNNHKNKHGKSQILIDIDVKLIIVDVYINFCKEKREKEEKNCQFFSDIRILAEVHIDLKHRAKEATHRCY